MFKMFFFQGMFFQFYYKINDRLMWNGKIVLYVGEKDHLFCVEGLFL